MILASVISLVITTLAKTHPHIDTHTHTQSPCIGVTAATCVVNLMSTMYWLGVESRMIFMCSMTSLNGAISFIRSWLVMVAGTVRMHTIALRATSSFRDVILLRGSGGRRTGEGWTKSGRRIRGRGEKGGGDGRKKNARMRSGTGTE